MLFIVDFDGTIAPTDTVDALLERFAAPEWRRIEEQWVAGEINSQQCMQAQLGLVRADRDILENFLQSVDVDPFFAEFVRYARTFAEVAVVSDGLDYPIRHALQKLDMPAMTVRANHLVLRDDRVDISFPHMDPGCARQSGVCKCAVAHALEGGRGRSTVLIGDGRSDCCLAHHADHVFAKNSLRRYCEDKGIAHTPFETFHDVLAVVRTWDTVPFNPSLPERICPLEAP